MRILLQRCDKAVVSVADEVVGSIGKGLTLFVGLGQGDDQRILEMMVDKVINLRVFSDDHDKFMFSLLQVDAAILAIPQFTLFAEMRKGRRPEFFNALKPDLARSLFNDFCDLLTRRGVVSVGRGIFGAAMKVSVENDGPVSIMIDSKDFSQIVR